MKKACVLLIAVFMCGGCLSAVAYNTSAIDYYNRGTAYLKKGQYDLAIADLNMAIQLDPKNAHSHYHLAFIYHKKGNKELAKSHLLSAINIDAGIIEKRSEYLDRPSALKGFYAEELIALSGYIEIPSAILTKASGILKEVITTTAQAQKPSAQIPSIQTDIDRPYFNPEEKLMTDDDLAVIIGIEKYRGLPSSDYSSSDAKLMKDYLKALGFQPRNIEFLTDEKATKTDIEKSIEAWLKNKAKPQSRVFIYYSGHGAPEPKTGDAYIVPYDGDPNYLEVTGYPLKRLYESFGKLPAKEIIVALDSCFSGAGGRSVIAKGARPLVMMTERVVLPQHIAVLTATQGTQISTSNPEKGHGIFTYYFLKAIKEGKKTLAEIYEYIKPLIENKARELNAEQSPDIIPKPEMIKGRFTLRK
ncbi:MAG: caspase family protein [Nitrospirota bacterium]